MKTLDTEGILFEISIISCFTLRCFQSKEFNGFQIINQFTEGLNEPHLLPTSVKTVIHHYRHILKSDSNCDDKATSQAIT